MTDERYSRLGDKIEKIVQSDESAKKPGPPSIVGGIWISYRWLFVGVLFCATTAIAFYVGRQSRDSQAPQPKELPPAVAPPHHRGKDVDADDRVAWFRKNVYRQMTQQDFDKLADKRVFMDAPDKHDFLATLEAEREFRPLIALPDGGASVDRYFPFETPKGPAYRINILWRTSRDDVRGIPLVGFPGKWVTVIEEYYLRSP